MKFLLLPSSGRFQIFNDERRLLATVEKVQISGPELVGGGQLLRCRINAAWGLEIVDDSLDPGIARILGGGGAFRTLPEHKCFQITERGFPNMTGNCELTT